MPLYPFKVDVVITNNGDDLEVYSINGALIGSSVNNLGIPPTDINGKTTLTVGFLSAIDRGDGLSLQVKTFDDKIVGSAFTYIKP